METLEHFAKICMNARQLGGAKELSMERIEQLMAVRKKLKIPGRHPGYRKYS